MNKERKGPVALLKEDFEKLEETCKKTHEDYLRSLADFDNYRRRVERDSEISRRMALERLIIDLLPVLDNFDRAAAAAAGGKETESVRKGMDLINRQLREVLCRHGLQEYSCVGTEFDPRKAEAISFVQSAEHESNMVVTEVCKGYSCDGRVIRPAKVIVAKGSEKKAEAGSEADQPEGGAAETSGGRDSDAEAEAPGVGAPERTGEIPAEGGASNHRDHGRARGHRSES